MIHSRTVTPKANDAILARLRSRIESYERRAEKLATKYVRPGDWPRPERQAYARRCILRTTLMARELVQLLAPTDDWTLPPRTVQPYLDEFFDALHDWVRSGDASDFHTAYTAARNVVSAVRRAAGVEARRCC